MRAMLLDLDEATLSQRNSIVATLRHARARTAKVSGWSGGYLTGSPVPGPGEANTQWHSPSDTSLARGHWEGLIRPLYEGAWWQKEQLWERFFGLINQDIA